MKQRLNIVSVAGGLLASLCVYGVASATISTISNSQAAALPTASKSQQVSTTHTADGQQPSTTPTLTVVQKQPLTTTSSVQKAPVATTTSVAESAKAAVAQTSLTNSPVSTTALIDLAKQATLSAFTYDYKNYRTNLSKTATFFTNSGWQAYSNALRRSGNIDGVKNDSMQVQAKLNGHPQLVKQQFFNGERAWQVKVPVIVSYVGKAQKVEQKLDVDVMVVPVASRINSRGIAIEQFIAKADETTS